MSQRTRFIDFLQKMTEVQTKTLIDEQRSMTFEEYVDAILEKYIRFVDTETLAAAMEKAYSKWSGPWEEFASLVLDALDTEATQ